MPDASVIERGRATLRRAAAADNDQIAAIWNREVVATSATTDTEPRTPAAQRRWLARHGAAHPVVVAVDGDEVLAYGSLSPYRGKRAFRATVEDSVYVKAGARGMGLGGRDCGGGTPRQALRVRASGRAENFRSGYNRDAAGALCRGHVSSPASMSTTCRFSTATVTSTPRSSPSCPRRT